MRFKTPVKKWLSEYLVEHKFTRKKLGKKFGCLYCHLNDVINYRKPCSWRLLSRLAAVLGKDLEVIGVAFGYYPSDWLWFTRSHPEKALSSMLEILAKEGIEMKGTARLKRTQRNSQAAFLNEGWDGGKTAQVSPEDPPQSPNSPE